jgi:aquaporin rerated protein, other eukaryote
MHSRRSVESTDLASQIFLTAGLVFTIFMLAAEKHKATFIAPVGIGLSLFIAELFGVYYTGGSLNPARSFGPCVVLGSFSHYHWIYWVGPVLGAMLASGFYMFIKALEYETVNPEQDAEGDVGHAFDPNTGTEKRVSSDLHRSRHGQISVASPGPRLVATERETTSDDNLGYNHASVLESGVGPPAP